MAAKVLNNSTDIIIRYWNISKHVLLLQLMWTTLYPRLSIGTLDKSGNSSHDNGKENVMNQTSFFSDLWWDNAWYEHLLKWNHVGVLGKKHYLVVLLRTRRHLKCELITHCFGKTSQDKTTSLIFNNELILNVYSPVHCVKSASGKQRKSGFWSILLL